MNMERTDRYTTVWLTNDGALEARAVELTNLDGHDTQARFSRENRGGNYFTVRMETRKGGFFAPWETRLELPPEKIEAEKLRLLRQFWKLHPELKPDAEPTSPIPVKRPTRAFFIPKNVPGMEE
jgi:hypothetical protein